MQLSDLPGIDMLPRCKAILLGRIYIVRGGVCTFSLSYFMGKKNHFEVNVQECTIIYPFVCERSEKEYESLWAINV